MELLKLLESKMKQQAFREIIEDELQMVFLQGKEKGIVEKEYDYILDEIKQNAGQIEGIMRLTEN